MNEHHSNPSSSDKTLMIRPSDSETKELELQMRLIHLREQRSQNIEIYQPTWGQSTHVRWKPPAPKVVYLKDVKECRKK